MLSDAVALFDAAVREGWAVDGTDGFVYTVDWSGRPVVRQRMHWVAAEATATATALHRATGDSSYADWDAAWWQHIDRYFRDPVHGSWHHELAPDLHPSAVTWEGKPDTYHAFQATLFPRLPLAPTLARALADGLLEGGSAHRIHPRVGAADRLVGMHPCACCGYKTLPGSSDYDLCPVRWWEDEGVEPWEYSGPNDQTLVDAQQEYLAESRPYRRRPGKASPPRRREARDADWRPFERPTSCWLGYSAQGRSKHASGTRSAVG